MSGKHGDKPFEGHMHDYLAHIQAVEEDLEYYRAKRFEPRILYLLRRGVVSFYDLFKVRAALKKNEREPCRLQSYLPVLIFIVSPMAKARRGRIS